MSHVVPPGFLFRWSIKVEEFKNIPQRSGRLLDLPEQFRLPSFSELDGRKDFADVRLAWNDEGIGVSVEVRERPRKVQCDLDAPRKSDGITIWIDTRSTPGVHRATRFCHQFTLLPTSGWLDETEPVVVQIPLSRAREESTSVDLTRIRLASEVKSDGYWLEAWFPKDVFTGYDPSVSPKLGFHYIVHDRDYGEQTLSVGTEFPVDVDPSLWQTIELKSAR